MGIPRLRGHLEKYAEYKNLGCNRSGCSRDSSTIVIDGPSLAHHIFSKLSSTSEIITLHSHLKTGEALVNYLNQLEHVNIKM